tara:strand:+ start:1677 stop:2177 length:501 start_codon:yes stop_codon:yes gene_type:complete
MNIKNICICAFILYVVLWIRYSLNAFPDDNTLHIESRNIPVRSDNLLTLYENPVSFNDTGRKMSDKRIHRYFSSKIISCDLPRTKQSYIFIFAPSQTENLYTSYFKINPIKQKQISNVLMYDIDLNKYPLYKNSVYTEIPLSGNQSLYVPRGWWIYTDTPESFTIF